MMNIVLYSSSASLRLPTTSLIEEFKVVKVHAHLVLMDSRDTIIREVQQDICTRRK